MKRYAFCVKCSYSVWQEGFVTESYCVTAMKYSTMKCSKKEHLSLADSWAPCYNSSNAGKGEDDAKQEYRENRHRRDVPSVNEPKLSWVAFSPDGTKLWLQGKDDTCD